MRKLHLANESLIEWEEPGVEKFTPAPLTVWLPQAAVGIGLESGLVYVIFERNEDDLITYEAVAFFANGYDTEEKVIEGFYEIKSVDEAKKACEAHELSKVKI